MANVVLLLISVYVYILNGAEVKLLLRTRSLLRIRSSLKYGDPSWRGFELSNMGSKPRTSKPIGLISYIR